MPVEPPSSAKSVEIAIAETWPSRLWKDMHVVLAVSGGADSVAMLRAMLRLKLEAGGGGRIYVGHLNHGLRATVADDDAAWLVKLCQEHKLPLEIGNAKIRAQATAAGDGWESAAREARYQFLREFAERIGARYVAVAHTVDDQVETVLHRIVRGTGLAGLRGIPFSRALSPAVTIIRPLLTVSHDEALRYLASLGQDFRIDSTNEDLRFMRNRVRHDLLPRLRKGYNAKTNAALLRLSAQASEAQEVIADFAAVLMGDCVSIEPAAPSGGHARRIRVDCTKLAQHPRPLIREVLKLAWTQARWPQQDMGYKEWEKLAELVIRGDARTLNMPDNVQAERRLDVVTLTLL